VHLPNGGLTLRAGPRPRARTSVELGLAEYDAMLKWEGWLAKSLQQSFLQSGKAVQSIAPEQALATSRAGASLDALFTMSFGV